MEGLNDDELVWIFGSSRSGSTWLMRMLGELDGVVAIDDPHLGHHLGPWRPVSISSAVAEEEPELRVLREVKGDKDGYFFNDRYRRAWEPALRELISARFSAEAEERCPRGRRAVVVKEPGSQAADMLVSLFPRSRIVFLLRDGRDVVDSWLDAYDTGSWAIGEGAFEVSPEGRTALIRWLARVWAYRTAAVRRVFEAHDPGRRVLVRYEDLLDDPAARLDAVARAVGLAEPREPTVAAIAERNRFDALPAQGTGPGSTTRAASPGGWRASMTPEERQVLYEALGEELERSGYGPPDVLAGAAAGVEGDLG